jgi:hypothetical protein
MKDCCEPVHRPRRWPWLAVAGVIAVMIALVEMMR